MPASSRLNFQVIWKYITDNPGVKKGLLVKELSKQSGYCESMLYIMENHGYLISEDDNGHIWPYKIVNWEVVNA